MSAAFDSRILYIAEVLSSTTQVLVPSTEEETLAAIASWRFVRRCGSTITLVDQ